LNLEKMTKPPHAGESCPARRAAGAGLGGGRRGCDNQRDNQKPFHTTTSIFWQRANLFSYRLLICSLILRSLWFYALHINKKGTENTLAIHMPQSAFLPAIAAMWHATAVITAALQTRS
jgi:hypothetical protein